MIPAVTASGGIEPILRQASAVTGTSFDFLLDTAERESALDPNAQAATSSARGLFQFVESTWLGMIDRYGAEYGLADYADAITRNADGSYSVADPGARQAILSLRTDPALSAVMAGELATENAAQLEATLGRVPSSGELYVAHFLGASGAATLISAAAASPDANATALFPRQAAANPGIFRSASGAQRTVAQVYDELVGRHSGAPAVDVAMAYAAPHAPAAENPGTSYGWTAAAPAGAFEALFRTDAPRSVAAGPLWSGFSTSRALFEVALAEDALVPSGAALDRDLSRDPVGPLPTETTPLDFTRSAAEDNLFAL